MSWLFTDFGDIPRCNCSLLKLSISRTPIAVKRNQPNAGLRCRSKMIVFDRTSLGLFVALAYVFKNSFANASNLGASRAVSESAAASRMLLVMQRQRSLLAPMGGPQVWQDVLWTVATLERAHPQLAAGGPQLEYPWEAPAGTIHWPARDLGIARAFGDPRRNLGTRVTRFTALLVERFDQIFP
ncbi:MAG TPA: hypothetical protein VK524_04405 [Polyangiaceae bacterium]|nr:hypothetical protein [Polyangiaceae bacterium]